MAISELNEYRFKRKFPTSHVMVFIVWSIFVYLMVMEFFFETKGEWTRFITLIIFSLVFFIRALGSLLQMVFSTIVINDDDFFMRIVY